MRRHDTRTSIPSTGLQETEVQVTLVTYMI